MTRMMRYSLACIVARSVLCEDDDGEEEKEEEVHKGRFVRAVT